MNNNAVRKILGGVVLTVLWILCFLFISPSLVIDFGGGVTLNLLLVSIIVGLLIIFFYHQFYRSSVEANKLSWTSVLTISWLALIIFFPFRTNPDGGAVGFFALLGGLAVCVLWVHFFSDEISLEA
ncbi:MAG: hypothetical protein ACRDHW_11545 [Ktedonobacteraceae bacterium]